MSLVDLTGDDWESYWRRRREFLHSSGYKLRPKFSPDFATNLQELSTRALRDYKAHYFHEHVMDAERISDGRKVMLKFTSNSIFPEEVRIAQLFSSPPHAGEPRNHCVPILEVLNDPEDDDKHILVMPRLLRFHKPPFDTVGEVVDCFRQVFEGINYMHENFVAHRDCGINNIMQDPTKLYPGGVHPVKPWWDPDFKNFSRPITRTQCWPRYYLIDFGHSPQYDAKNGLPFEEVLRGGDKSPPEHRQDACNPFPTDIYFLGNLLKTQFLYSKEPCENPKLNLPPVQYPPLRFLAPLIEDMTHPDPARRPTIGEVIERFDKLTRELSWAHLRRPGQILDAFDIPGQART
ncbi:kinase-like domain-containing protein [Mycena filopes]|nr:kinase-like domain-containing protein [Mycena filopes]